MYKFIYVTRFIVYPSIYPSFERKKERTGGVNRVSIPATGRYCLATLMSSDRTKQICLWMTIYIYIYSPYPRGV